MCRNEDFCDEQFIETLEKEQMAQLERSAGFRPFQPGDTVRVAVKVVEGTRERLQAYEGVCIARQGRGFKPRSFTVRKNILWRGRRCACFPLYSPLIDSIHRRPPRQRSAGRSSIICAACAASSPHPRTHR